MLYADVDGIISRHSHYAGFGQGATAIRCPSRIRPLRLWTGATIPIWIRDQVVTFPERHWWKRSRSAGSEEFRLSMLFIPRQSAEDLRRLIVDAEAAQQTLDARGNPNRPLRGKRPDRSMESRRAEAAAKRDRLVKEVVAAPRYSRGRQRGFSVPPWKKKVRSAAGDALVRLFPRFKEADSGAWEVALKRAKERGRSAVPTDRPRRRH